MDSENMIGLVTEIFVSIIMIGIGISQLMSKNPVGFYSGEKPPNKDDLTDVKAWNKKHGIMWIIYGIVIICSFFIGMLMGDTILSVIPICGGIIFPVFIMIGYHTRLRKKYFKNNKLK